MFLSIALNKKCFKPILKLEIFFIVKLMKYQKAIFAILIIS